MTSRGAMLPSASSAGSLLAELRQAGVVLAVNGDRLHYSAPLGVMTPEFLAAVKKHKPALLRLLVEREAAPTPPLLLAPSTPACDHNNAVVVLQVRDHGLICGPCWSRWVRGGMDWPRSGEVARTNPQLETSPQTSREPPAKPRSEQ